MDRIGMVVVLASWLQYSCGCDPDFCVNRIHGAKFVDPTDPSFYYVCDWGRAQYMPCAGGLVFSELILNCVFPDPGATQSPVTDTSTGVVVNGYCVASGGSGTTPGPVTTVTATSTATTGNQQKTPWNLYEKHPNRKSACVIHQILRVPCVIFCGVTCSQTNDCTDFNIFILDNDGEEYECHLLTCSNGYLLQPSVEYDFYQRI